LVINNSGFVAIIHRSSAEAIRVSGAIVEVVRVELKYSVPENLAAWALRWSGVFLERDQGELIRELDSVHGIQDALLVAYDGATEV
jgi:hypothetical protein